MSRSGSKTANKNKGSRKERQQKAYNQTAIKRVKKPSITLSEYIKDIRENYVNLSTTCSHKCECCRVAMPAMHHCQFVDIVTEIWDTYSDEEKINLILTSIEYYFRYSYEKWGMDHLIKPCMLLDKNGLCRHYNKRPLNCSLYGLWPKEEYEKRVDKFEKEYSKYGLKREDLPLNTQCLNVKRVDDSVPLTIELIESLFAKLDKLDKKTGNFTELEISQKVNYMTFADHLIKAVLGEEWKVKMTQFILAADKATMEDQIKAIKEVFTKEFLKNGIPDVRKVL